MTRKVELANGTILEFPDGTSLDVIQKAVKRIIAGGAQSSAAPPADTQPPAELGPPLAGFGPGGSDLEWNQPGYAEAKQLPPQPVPIPWSNLPGQMAGNAMSSGGQAILDTVTPFIHPVDTAKSMGSALLGVARKSGIRVGDSDDVKAAESIGKYYADRLGGVEEIKRTAASDPAGLLMDITGVASLGSGALARAPGTVGKISRGVQKVADVAEPVGLASKVVGTVLGPKAGGPAQRLVAQGVNPTVGQIWGGVPKKVEDTLESYPVVGTVIKEARQRANKQLNQAAYNRALAPIGENAKGLTPGASGISDVSDKLSDAYEALLPHIELVVDDQLISEIGGAVNNAKNIVDSNVGSTLEKIVGVKVMERLLKGNVPGPELNMMQEDISGIAGEMKLGTASERMAGKALDRIQDAIKESLVRTNPDFAAELNAINTGYANYARLRAAGGASGADVGGFTPPQLRAAVKSTDKSVGKGDTARGRALMQDLAMDSRSVMGDNLANSGSIDRALMIGLATGAYAIDPMAAALLGVASSPYIPGVQGGIAKVLAGERSAPVRATGAAVSRYGPRVGKASFQAERARNEIEKRTRSKLNGT